MPAKMALVLLATVFMAIAVGCGGVGSGRQFKNDASPPPVPGAPFSAIGGFATKDSTVAVSRAPESVDRRIVRNVTMSMLVKDIPDTLKAIASLAEGVGGFVVTSSLSGEEESQRAFVSVRVPAEQTETVLAQFRGMAVRVVSEQTSSQDVTEEYVDLEASKRTLERTESQLVSLMDRAQTVEDVLKVQRELSNVQGQLEQSKGRMQYLERTSDTALITVELRPATSPRRLVEAGWNPLETAKGAVRGLSDFGQGIVDVAIRVGVFAPVWVPLLAVAWWGAWYLRRKVGRG